MGDKKQKLRQETERLVKEAMLRKGVTIEKLKTRIDVVCGKCGYRGHLLVPPGSERVSFTCKECGHPQNTI
jgi:transcription elongation factor Elf1